MSDSTIPAEGSVAPGFKLAASGKQSIELKDFKNKKTVVLYFYPRADTPGCTKEACGFRDALADYDNARVAILGISPDPVEDVQKFSDKFHLNFPLLADSDHKVAEEYGVWVKKQNYGKEYMGVARTTFVIDKSGTISKVFRNVKPEGHDQEVLSWLKTNLGS
jgi:thioredoxin-dependent peroxiredoxin